MNLRKTFALTLSRITGRGEKRENEVGDRRGA
jgi:hypothetical protein